MILTALLLQSTLTAPVSAPAEGATTEPVAVTQEGEEKSWTIAADVSLTRLEGNTETTTGAANIVYSDYAGLREWTLGAHWAATRQQDAVTGDSTTTSRLFLYDGTYNYFFSEEKHMYAYGKAAHRTNIPDGLDHRTDVGLGAGYRFGLYEGDVDDLDGKAEVEAGVSWVADEKVGLEEETGAAFRGAYLFDTPVDGSLSIVNFGEYLSNGDEIEAFTHETGLKWDLNSTLYLALTWAVSWDGNPAPGFESTDRRYVLLLGATF